MGLLLRTSRPITLSRQAGGDGSGASETMGFGILKGPGAAGSSTGTLSAGDMPGTLFPGVALARVSRAMDSPKTYGFRMMD